MEYRAGSVVEKPLSRRHRGMNLSSRSRILLFAFVALNAPSLSPAQEGGSLEQAADKIISWFTGLASKARQIGTQAERGYLVDRLTDLNREIYLLETDKEYLVRDALSRTPVNAHEIGRVATELQGRILAIRSSLRDIGARLSTEHAAGGFEVDLLLRDALQDRKNFVFRLQDRLASGLDPEPLSQFRSEGERAIMALRKARNATGDLIAKLNASASQPSKK
jgi:hypothetical protein